MSAEDWLWGPYQGDYLFEDDSDREVTCKFCGERRLYWLACLDVERGIRWRLVNAKGEPHRCAAPPASPDEFETMEGTNEKT